MGKAILLSGACGSGKSTVMGLGYRALEAQWGPTATIDTDTILMMVDPRWELAHEERRYELTGHVEWMRARYRSWSCRIDNTSLGPEAVLAEMAERIGRGEGRLTGPLPAL